MSNDNIAFDSITRYAVAGRATTDAFKGLRDVAEQYQVMHGTDWEASAEQFARYCEEGETEFMEANYANEPKAKHVGGRKAGQWKFRSYLPSAYSTAKTELRKALEQGISVHGKGKSELAKARKEATPPKAVTPADQADAIAKTTDKLRQMIKEYHDPAEALRYVANELGLTVPKNSEESDEQPDD